MRGALAVALAAFFVLLPGLSPVHGWLDGGELAAAVAELGVPHPPGVPGYVHLSHLLQLVPVGTPGLRAAAASAVFAALCLGLVYDLLRRQRVSRTLSATCALWPLADRTFVRAARVAEIYAFEALVTVVVLWCLHGPRPMGLRARYRLVAAFAATFGALGFGDLRLAFVPWLGWWFLGALRKGSRVAGLIPVAVAAGLLAVLTVALAGRREPMAAWGQVGTLAGLWDHLQATSIRASFRHEILPASPAAWKASAAAFFERMGEDLGPVGAVLAVASGLVLPLRKGRPRRRALAALCTYLGLVHVFYAVGINPMGEADRQTGGLLAPLCALLVGLGADTFLRRMGRARWALSPLLVAMIVGPPAVASYRDADVTGSLAPSIWVHASFDQLPAGGVLLTQSDDLAAGLRYARAVEGARPDAWTVPAQHLYRAPVGELARATPLRRPLRAARGGRTDAERVRIFAATYRGPVGLEHGGTGLFDGVAVGWPPSGRPPVLLLRDGGGEAVDGPAEDVRRTLAILAPIVESTEDRRRLADAATRRVVAWIHAAGGLGRASADLLAECLAGLRNVLETVDPSHAHALSVTAAIFDRLGRRERALAAARRVLELEPDGERALLNYALYLSRAGPQSPDFRRALTLAARAASLRPWHDRPWEMLVRLYEQAGDRARAERARARDRDLLAGTR